jgi:hypothetical protein
MIVWLSLGKETFGDTLGFSFVNLYFLILTQKSDAADVIKQF